MIFKHLITTSCPRRCSYCITKNVPLLNEPSTLAATRERYLALFEMGYHEVMLTGGEPTAHPCYPAIVRLAWSVFGAVHLTTQNEAVLAGRNVWSDRLLASVVFSIHDRSVLRRLPNRLSLLFPVYASVMARSYFDGLVSYLRFRGFAGLSVNEDARGTEVFDEARLPAFPGFNVRVNRRGNCLDGTLMLLPDLTEIFNFRPYL